MRLAALLTLAVALAMDAFAVALATSVCLRRATGRQTLRLCFHFALFQALMPILGFGLGLTVRQFVAAWNNWAVLIILGLVGLKMIWEGLAAHEEACETRDPTKGFSLVVLSLAVSLDALAVGLSLSVLHQSVWVPALVIGLVCFAVSALGMRLGRLMAKTAVVSRYAEVLGGAVLVGLGVVFFLEA
jgi:putative Mn2+ efflux pump MntP